MAIKKELVQFTIKNDTNCNFNIPLFQQNVYSINATTKYSWNVTSASLACGTGTIIINSVTYNLTYAPNLAGLLAALNALGFGFFCSETVGPNTFIYTVDDTNIYSTLDLCSGGTTTTTTTSTTTIAPTTSTTTSTTTAPTTSTTTSTTTAPTTSTTTTTTTDAGTTTSTTTTTTTDAGTTTSTTTTTTTDAGTTTSTTTTTTTDATTTTSTTTTTTTDATTTTSTTTSTTTTGSSSWTVRNANCGFGTINDVGINGSFMGSLSGPSNFPLTSTLFGTKSNPNGIVYGGSNTIQANVTALIAGAGNCGIMYIFINDMFTPAHTLYFTTNPFPQISGVVINNGDVVEVQINCQPGPCPGVTTSTTTTTTTEAPTTTTTTTTSSTTSTTTLTPPPACVTQVSFDVTTAGDAFIEDCCGIQVLNSYSVGSYTETLCVPTNGNAVVPVDAVITNIVYGPTPCSCNTTTTSTTTTTTTGLARDFSFDFTGFGTCSQPNVNTLFVPVGTASPVPSGTILYGDPACTTPYTISTYTYVVQIIGGNTTGNTIFEFDFTTGTIGNTFSVCP